MLASGSAVSSGTKDAAAMLSAAAVMGGISCGEVCGKKLGCGEHACQSPCHAGECAPCAVEKIQKCYCGASATPMRCGEGTPETSTSLGGNNSWQGFWSCDRACERKFDCNVHTCSRSCHPLSAESAICPRSPAQVTTCPCGREPITDRASCEDPIPTCGRTCDKLLPCGHQCEEKCHAGDCSPCSVPITLPCRCGETKQTRPCHQQKVSADEDKEILCKTVCKALRNCGKHQCNRQCCPLYFQAKSKSKRRPTAMEMELQDPAGFHACDVVCGKPLGCKRHDCERTCHRGPCGRCLQSSFEEASCHCGRTVLEPPIQCGTAIQCNFPCVRPPPPCGHPSLPHNCHESEQCPPCVYLTEKLCHCKKTLVPNVPCSRTNVHCGVTCNAVLGCGFHRCQGVCHQAPADCAPCSQVCGKPRKLCGHACTASCHAPSSCPETQPCQAIIALQCACGNLQQKVKCNSSIAHPRTERALKCNDTCAIAQRNARMAEALGISTESTATVVQYPESVLNFYALKRKEAEEIEQTLTSLIQSPRHGLILPSAKKEMRKFTHELAECYGITSESVDEEPQRSVMLRRTGQSKVPSNSLRDAFQERALEQGVGPSGMLRKAPPSVTLTQMRKTPSAGGPTTAGSAAYTPAWNSVVLEGVFGHDESSLRAALDPLLRHAGSYSVKWVTHEDVLLYPSSTSASAVLSSGSPLAFVARHLDSLRNTLKPTGAVREVVPSVADLTHSTVSVKGQGTDAVSMSTASSGRASPWGSAARASASSSGRASPAVSGAGGWAAVASRGLGGTSASSAATASANNASTAASLLYRAPQPSRPAATSSNVLGAGPFARPAPAAVASAAPASSSEDVPDEWDTSEL